MRFRLNFTTYYCLIMSFLKINKTPIMSCENTPFLVRVIPKRTQSFLNQFYKLGKFLLLTILAIIWVSACSPNSSDSVFQEASTRTIKHTMGETAVPANPPRIIAFETFTF
jgi:hypothetical protein